LPENWWKVVRTIYRDFYAVVEKLESMIYHLASSLEADGFVSELNQITRGRRSTR
jgi:hypothetical protein